MYTEYTHLRGEWSKNITERNAYVDWGYAMLAMRCTVTEVDLHISKSPCFAPACSSRGAHITYKRNKCIQGAAATESHLTYSKLQTWTQIFKVFFFLFFFRHICRFLSTCIYFSHTFLCTVNRLYFSCIFLRRQLVVRLEEWMRGRNVGWWWGIRRKKRSVARGKEVKK